MGSMWLRRRLDEDWTHGAIRALWRAERLAVAAAADCVDPWHLLTSLRRDEGRGGELLDRWLSAAITPTIAAAADSPDDPAAERFEPPTSLQRSERPDSRLMSLLAATETDEPMPGQWQPGHVVLWGTDTLLVVDRARHLAAHSGAEPTAGTDHLVRALAEVPSAVATHLQTLNGVSAADGAAVDRTIEPHRSEVDLNLRLRSSHDRAHGQTETYRVLDASANRAREGLRVVEDYARFVLNDRQLSEHCKRIRHHLQAALELLPANRLLTSRDTPGDVGTRIATAAEYHRSNPQHVAIASCKRVQEALRTLEEYGKLVSQLLPPKIEQLRYEMYTLEQAVVRRQSVSDQFTGLAVYVLITESECDKGPGPTIDAAMQAGVRLFQVREKQKTDRELIEYCHRVRRLTRAGEARLIINDRPDIAALVDADGVHVGQDELSVADARRIVGPDRWVGVSTHSVEQARQAVLDGADYLGVGPVFPSTTKSFTAFPGLDLVRAVSAEIQLPWFAIGGITSDRLPTVLAAGAERVAVSAAVCRSADPYAAATELLSQMSVTE
jgi:thiamine-phosphate pyrophosphorylase